MRAGVLLVAVLAGCWTHTEPAPRSTPVLTNQAAPAARTDHGHRSVWLGRYRCRQGATALRLTIDRSGNGLAATFEFGPLDENPAVPSGAFRMTGEATPVADGTMVRLRATEWIEQPARYELVDVDALVTGGRLMRGRVTNPGCGTLEVTRVD